MKLQLKDFERGISKYWEVVNSRSGCVQDTETEFPKFAGIYLWLPVVIVSSFLAGTLVGTGRAQTSPRKPPKYIQVDSMKVQPANEDDYVKVEKEGWKPIHQERIKQGKLHSWYFFGVDFPSGTETKYNDVTVNTFDQWGQLENPYADLGAMAQKSSSGNEHGRVLCPHDQSSGDREN